MQLIPRKHFPHIWREILFPIDNLLCLTPLKIVLLLQKEFIATEMDERIYHRQKAFGERQLYLHRHDLPAGHVSHLLHHPVRTSPQFHYGLQVIGLHLKVLQQRKVIMQEERKKIKDIDDLVLSLASPNVLRAISALQAGSTRRCLDSE